MAFGLAALVDLFEHADVDVGALLAEENPFARGRAVLDRAARLAARAARRARRRRPAVARPRLRPRAALRAAPARPRADRRARHRALGAERSARRPPPTCRPGRCEVLELGPLGLDALRRVLAGVVEAISRPALERIHEVSGGNPLYAIELARGARATAGRRAAAALPLPDSLQAAIAQRLESVPAELCRCSRRSSALGPTTRRPSCATASRRSTSGCCRSPSSRACWSSRRTSRVRFSHPLIGSVVYGRHEPARRGARCTRASPRGRDPDVRARHLALSTDGPSAPVAQLLEEAAARARARGAFDLAAEFAGHSLRLTPPGRPRRRRCGARWRRSRTAPRRAR